MFQTFGLSVTATAILDRVAVKPGPRGTQSGDGPGLQKPLQPHVGSEGQPPAPPPVLERSRVRPGPLTRLRRKCKREGVSVDCSMFVKSLANLDSQICQRMGQTICQC